MDSEARRRNLGYFFDGALARVPDKVAIIDLFGGRERRATYRELDARMTGVARMLARLGVRPGERLAMLVGNRTEFVEFFFGTMRTGAIPLLLNGSKIDLADPLAGNVQAATDRPELLRRHRSCMGAVKSCGAFGGFGVF